MSAAGLYRLDKLLENRGVAELLAPHVEPAVEKEERAAGVSPFEQDWNDGERLFAGLAVQGKPDLGPLPVADLLAD